MSEPSPMTVQPPIANAFFQGLDGAEEPHSIHGDSIGTYGFNCGRVMVARGWLCYAGKDSRFQEVVGLRSSLEGLLGQTAEGLSAMRTIRAPKSISNRSAERSEASAVARVSARAGFGSQCTNGARTVSIAHARRRSVPVVAEFYVPDRASYAFGAGGIRLAVTPRGTGATHGVGRLNEETA